MSQRPESQLHSAITCSVCFTLLALIVLCALLTGCEEGAADPGYHGNAELVAVAQACQVEQEYGPMPRTTHMEWADESYVYAYTIYISREVQGTPWVTNHVCHEVAELYLNYIYFDDAALQARIDSDHAINQGIEP